MGRNQRQLKNFFVSPGFQLKFAAYFIVFSILMIGMLFLTIFQKINQIRYMITATDVMSISIQSQVNQMLFEIIVISVVVFSGFSIITVLYSIVVSHRIAGPVVAINHFIDDLKKGDYDSKRELRKNDELKPIMANLKELAQILKNKS